MDFLGQTALVFGTFAPKTSVIDEWEPLHKKYTKSPYSQKNHENPTILLPTQNLHEKSISDSFVEIL